MNYKEITEQKGMLFKKKYKPELVEISNTKKGRIRQRVNSQVFDPEDSIADNSKLIFLLLSILVKLYDADFDKANLAPDDQIIIESFIELAKDSDNRFIEQFEREGYALLTKLLARQSQIANIIATEYSTNTNS